MGLTIRTLHELAEFEAVYRLFDQIWRPAPDNPPVTVELMLVLAHAGNYVAAAYEDGEMVGASVGFFGPPEEHTLHSHIAGVAPGGQGRNVGFALKSHQRQWALDRGVTTVRWTFDPLVARNAYFNLTKLGAGSPVYLENFYGAMPDELNVSDESDRLLVTWDLENAKAGVEPDLAQLLDSGATVGLDVGSDQFPVSGKTSGRLVLIAVPQDIYQLRSDRPDAARAWRVALREVLGGLLGEGATISAFIRSGWYVVAHPATS